MKQIITILLTLCLAASVWAQSPEKMSYQAVVRNSSNELVTNQQVGMRISILQGSASGTSEYTETQSASTNANGLVSFEIGTGSTSDDFTAIDWASGTYFIQTETDPDGGSNYSITGTSQLLSVPYAMYAKTAGNAQAGPAGADGASAYQTWLDLGNTGTEAEFVASLSGTSETASNTSAIEVNEAAIALNTAKTGISAAQASEITVNTAKIGLSATQNTTLSNTSGTNTGDQDISGISTNATAIALNTDKAGYTEALVSANTDVVANTAKTGYSEALVSANTDVVANTAKVGYSEALVSANTDVVANTAKVGYTEALVSANTDVAANTSKVGYTEALVSANTDVIANTSKVGYTEALVSANTDVVANTAKVGLTPGTSPGQMQYWDGVTWITVAPGSTGQILTFVNGVPVWVGDPITNVVANPTTGKIWMDRNLGATQVATSSTDVAAYGDLYQWGRGSDGHQQRTSATTSTLSGADVPGHADFIITPGNPNDWRSTQNDNLWQGVSGVNNPCPSGYRLPTDAEWDAERLSWSSNDAAGAYASPLKLSLAVGLRSYSNGVLYSVGSYGNYWSSTVDGAASRNLTFNSGNANTGSSFRATGFSVRCIKD